MLLLAHRRTPYSFKQPIISSSLPLGYNDCKISSEQLDIWSTQVCIFIILDNVSFFVLPCLHMFLSLDCITEKSLLMLVKASISGVLGYDFCN